MAWLSQWLKAHPDLGLYTECSAPPNLQGIEVDDVQQYSFTCDAGVGQFSYFIPNILI